MAGLKTIKKTALAEPSQAVALTLPGLKPVKQEGVRLVESRATVPGEIGVQEPAYQWPISFMRRENFSKGAYLFRIGDQADKLYYISKGLIRLPEINKLVKAGQVIGELGIFSPGKERTASALCEEDIEAYTMGREEVMKFFSRDPGLAINLIQLSIKRLIENLKAETETRERIKSELRIAHEIQNSMLPRAFPARKEFEIYAAMEPAREVGGDLYDFFFVDKTRLCVIVGDVSGKGVPAALFMAISKALLKSEAMRGYSAHEIISRVNNLLCPDNQRCMFVTVLCLILNTETGEVEFCNGGHNPPLLCANGGPIELVDAPKGMVVGFMENCEYASRKMVLKAGDLIFLYTDGVTEAINPQNQLFSEKRLKSILAPLRNKPVPEIVEGVKREVAVHVQGEPQFDDITLLALRYNGVS